MTEANYTAIAPKCTCGGVVTKVFKNGRFGKYCGACRGKQSGEVGPCKREAACLLCGIMIASGRSNRKFCSAICRSRESDRRQSKTGFTRAEYLDAMRAKSQASQGFTCIQCGKESKRKLSSTNKARGFINRYCSLACRVQANAAAFALVGPKTPKFCKVVAEYCEACARPFVSRQERAYCSEECRCIAARTAPTTKDCKCCGESYEPAYTGGSVSDYCSDTCRERVAAAAKRTDKARRKAVLAGVTIERVDPFVVFYRDKWRCQLCGCQTPKSKRGTYDDDAPELDHIQPLSRGGEHSYRNTQCACRKCNGLKSDTPRGQLLLIG